MAFMMKVCGLNERNATPGNPYRYLTGWLNEQTRIVIMPNRDKRNEDDPDWFLYMAPVAAAVTAAEPDAERG